MDPTIYGETPARSFQFCIYKPPRNRPFAINAAPPKWRTFTRSRTSSWCGWSACGRRWKRLWLLGKRTDSDWKW